MKKVAFAPFACSVSRILSVYFPGPSSNVRATIGPEPAAAVFAAALLSQTPLSFRKYALPSTVIDLRVKNDDWWLDEEAFKTADSDNANPFESLNETN